MFASRRFLPYVLALLLVTAVLSWAGITGSISGVVNDSSGAVVPGATVSVTNTQTGIKASVNTDGKCFYSLPTLAVGTYDVEIIQTGFKMYRKTRLVIDANSAPARGRNARGGDDQ
jgi:hypothetical protein